MDCALRAAGGGVDLGHDAGGPVEHGLGACPFRFGQSGVPQGHGFGVLGVCGPCRPVLGVVGGLRAARRVAHADQGLVGFRCAGELEAEGLAGIGEPAVVGHPDVQGS
jgi:hypothetical protein